MFNCYAIHVLELQTLWRTTRMVSIKKNITGESDISSLVIDSCQKSKFPTCNLMVFRFFLNDSFQKRIRTTTTRDYARFKSMQF